MANPHRLWVGVPPELEASGRKLIATNVAISDTAPLLAAPGSLWWESDSGILWIRYKDADTEQWVQASGLSEGGGGGDGGAGTGDSYTKVESDLRYVKLSGDTMSGGLTIGAGSYAATLALRDTSTGFGTTLRTEPAGGLSILNSAGSAVIANVNNVGSFNSATITATANLYANGSVFSGAGAANSGTYYFGVNGGQYLTFDTANFSLQGGQLIVNQGLYTPAHVSAASLQVSGLSSLTGISNASTIYSLGDITTSANMSCAGIWTGTLNASGAANVAASVTSPIFYHNGNSHTLSDGSNYIIRAAGATHVQNTVGAPGPLHTGSIINSGLTQSNFGYQAGPGNPQYLFHNTSNARTGAIYYNPGDNTFVWQHDAAGPWMIAMSANGMVQLAGGMRGKGGMNGGYVPNTNNFAWDPTGGRLSMFIDNTYMGPIAMEPCDYRIKKDVVSLASMWDTVKALRPIKYTQAEYMPQHEIERIQNERAAAQRHAEENDVEPEQRTDASIPLLFVSDDVERWGFIAHELQTTLIPSAASGVKDDPLLIQSPNPLTLLAAVTKALQEAMARIEAQDARIAALEAPARRR